MSSAPVPGPYARLEEELPGLAAAWREVLAAYDDPRRHEAFLELARTLGALDFAAQCYRARLEERPGEAETERRLRQVLFLATEVVLATRGATEDAERRAPYRHVVTLLVAFLLLVLLSVGLVPYLGKKLQTRRAAPGLPPSPLLSPTPPR